MSNNIWKLPDGELLYDIPSHIIINGVKYNASTLFDDDHAWEREELGIVEYEPSLEEVKERAVGRIKAHANALLMPTDWYIVREAETGEFAPADVLAERALIRQACADGETLILAAKTVEEVEAVEVAWPA